MSDLRHIAIILDGNRTWATEKGLPEILGHNEGAKNIKRIVLAALKTDVSYVTLYTLSTENLKNRTPDELKHLFSLFEKISAYAKLFHENKVRFKTIGDVSVLPNSVRKVLRDLAEQTKNYESLTLTFALNYGGRDEIVRATKKICANGNGDELTEELFANYLDTADYPDVDLMIRTGGYKRISNFLLWQTSYAELYFTDIKWPAFSEKDFYEAIDWFAAQNRKKGK